MQSFELLEVVQGRRAALSGRGRAIRQKAGLTIREMAAVVGVDVATLYRWEAGEFRPRQANAARWAGVLAALEQELTEERVR